MRHGFLLSVFLLFFILTLGAGCNQAEPETSAQPLAEAPVAEQHPDKPAETARYSLEEVRGHATADDCWLVINGKVYEATGMINQHPGGEAILKGCGQDASQMFANTKQGKGHSDKARTWLEDLYLGEVAQ